MRAVLVSLISLTVACAGRARPAVTLPTEPPPQEGRTSVRILNPADAARRAQGPEVTIVPAEPGPENRLPAYPANALDAGCREGRIPVRIHIGPTGRVVRQGPVPGRSAQQDACHQSFAAAVRGTVGEWGFFPAMRRVCTGQSAECTDTPITIHIDLEFLFEVVQGEGRVRAP